MSHHKGSVPRTCDHKNKNKNKNTHKKGPKSLTRTWTKVRRNKQNINIITITKRSLNRNLFTARRPDAQGRRRSGKALSEGPEQNNLLRSPV